MPNDPAEFGVTTADALNVPDSGGLAGDAAPNLALPWVVRLRYGMAAGEVAIVVAIWLAFRLNSRILWAILPLSVMIVSNIGLARLGVWLARFPEGALGVAFALDTVCLTSLLALTGGPMNPFSLLYLVQIALSAMVLHKVWTWSLGVLATACFGLLFFVHVPVAGFEGHRSGPGLSPHLVGMWIAFAIAATLITFFTGKIADTLRRREREVLALQARVAKNERLASLVTLAAGAAHELGTPLGTIAIVARELERYALQAGDNQPVLEDARLVRSEVERCRVILERMSAQGAEPLGETPVAIGGRELLNQVLDRLPEAARASLVLEADGSLMAVLPVHAAAQAISALAQNAIDANVQGRPIMLRVAASGEFVEIVVRDEGSGMAPDIVRHVAEPFFTTKAPGKGMGLGTFLVGVFAERLGGRLLFSSIPGQGTTATLLLPLILPKGANAKS
jgi:two-component system sensor histidine kinase RegB